MSHTVTIKTQFRDEKAIEAVCAEMGLPKPVRGTASLYQTSDKNLTGTIVRLNGWMFPVIINTATGEAKFDNMAGQWGKQRELDQFTQLYAVHKATIEARKKGYIVTRKQGTNGNVQLSITGM